MKLWFRLTIVCGALLGLLLGLTPPADWNYQSHVVRSGPCFDQGKETASDSSTASLVASMECDPARAASLESLVLDRALTVSNTGPPGQETHGPAELMVALGELPLKPATQTNAIQQPSPQIYWLSTAELKIGVPQQALASGDQLQIDLSHVLIGPFVFQPQVGESDLSLYDRQAVFLREFLFVLKLFGLGKLVELRELPVERALELEVENDTRNFASRASNPFGLALVEPVEGGIVPGLARLHESVIEGLPPAVVVDSLALKEVMCSLAEREVHGLLRVSGSAEKQALPSEVVQIT